MSRLPALLYLCLHCTCVLAPSCGVEDRAPQDTIYVGEALVIPQPREQTDGTGHFLVADDLTVSVENEEQARLLAAFREDWQQLTGTQLGVSVGGEGDIRLVTQAAHPPAGFTLDVAPEEVTLTAADGAGFFYGLQTLRQLMPPDLPAGSSAARAALPVVRITDAPRFPWRGFMLDVSRHFFTVDQVKEVIDRISALKMNRFHWHLTDDQGWRIEIDSYPKLTSVGAWRADRTNTDERVSDWWGRAPLRPGEEPSYGGFYTKEEIADIVAYAKARFVEVVPEIDMPGHSQAAVAAYPEIGCVNALTEVATGGVARNNTINPGKAATYAFAEAVLNEVMDLFPFGYVHIGGDECNKEQWRNDPAAQRKMREEGLATEEELQSYFITRMEQIINARGKAMIGWDEILEGGLAPNATVMSWRGEEGGIASVRAGHEVIMTPSEYTYLDLKQGHDDLEPNLGYSKAHLSTVYNYRVIPDSLSQREARLIKGIQANMWTESISDWGKFTYMTYPRLFAVAENAWSDPARKDWDDFTTRVLHANRRLAAEGTRHAVSAFSPWIHHKGRKNGIEIRLTTEANGLEVYYTRDGSLPDTTAHVYGGPFILTAGEKVHARSFRDGQPVGYPVALDLPVHRAGGARVTDAAGLPVPRLTDLQYARKTPVDSNWLKLDNNAEFTIHFGEPTEVSSLSLATLRYTISAIYPPERVAVAAIGPTSGGRFVPIRQLTQAEVVARQGRNRVTTTLDFTPTTVNALRIRLRAHAEIPEGHYRAGEAARMYLDELVVH